jgi:predicted RNase H-like HicB family nuclease
MLRGYMQAAMRRARYEILPDDGSYYGEIPALDGVFANAPTLEDCRDQLAEVLEDWILIGVAERHQLPVIDGIAITVKQSA